MRGWVFLEGGQGLEVKGRIREAEGSRESAGVLWGPQKDRRGLGGATWLSVLTLWASFFPIKNMGRVWTWILSYGLKQFKSFGKLQILHAHSKQRAGHPSPELRPILFLVPTHALLPFDFESKFQPWYCFYSYFRLYL